MRKSNLKSRGPSELLQAEDQQSVAEYSNQNMMFRVYSPRKNQQLQQASTFPTKFTMNIRRQAEVQPQIPYQRESYRNYDSNPNEILLLRRRNDQLQSKLEKYKGKIHDLKGKLKDQDSYIKFLEQCREGLISQSQDNIRKYQQYVSTLDLEFQEKNQTQAEQIIRLTGELQIKQRQIVELGKLLKNTEQEVKDLNSRLTSKEKQLQKVINQHQKEIEETQQYQSQQSQEKINQLQKDLRKQKLRAQQLIKDYQKALTDKQSVILKMSKFNNQMTQKMLTQKSQLFQYTHEEITMLMKHLQKGEDMSNLLKIQLTLKQSNSRLQKECLLLKQELRNMQSQHQKSRVIEEEQEQRIRDLEGLIYQKDKKIDEYCYFIENHQKSSQQVQILTTELAQLSRQLSSLHKLLQQRDQCIIRLQRELKNTQLQLKLKSQVNQLNIQKVRSDLTSQEQANQILRQRIKSVECLKRETPTVTSQNAFIDSFTPNHHSFKNSYQNLEPRDSIKNQEVTNQVKEIGKAFAQLSTDLQRLISDKLLKEQMQSGRSSTFYSKRGSQKQIESQKESRNYNERKTHGFKYPNSDGQQIFRLRELLANQKQNYSNIEKRLLNTIQRYHQGKETRNIGRDSYSPLPKSSEFIVQNQTYIPQNYQKAKSPPAISAYPRNAQQIRQKSSYQYQILKHNQSSNQNQNQNSPKIGSFIQSSKVDGKLRNEQGKSMSPYIFNRVIRDSDTQKTVESKMYKPNNNQRVKTDHRF